MYRKKWFLLAGWRSINNNGNTPFSVCFANFTDRLILQTDSKKLHLILTSNFLYTFRYQIAVKQRNINGVGNVQMKARTEVCL